MKTIVYTFLFVCIFTQGYAQKTRQFIVNSSQQKEGIALVLANNEYDAVGLDLDNAVADGQAITAALEHAQYDIEVGYNLTKNETLQAVEAFAEKIPNYKSAVIYYSGHGVQLNGENYLVPKDANSRSALLFRNSAINLNDLFLLMESVSIPKMVILDACRDNPFLEAEKNRNMSGGKGLALVKALDNSIVIFSTSPNTTVSDNNQFAEIFGEEIKKGGCIEKVIKQTRKLIKSKYPTQSIYTRDNLTGHICFGEENPNPIGNIDTDGDGLIDSKDQCPTEFGNIENLGCPVEIHLIIQKVLDSPNDSGLWYYEFINNIELVKTEAQQGNPGAMFVLGLAYNNAIGVPQKYDKAVYWYEKAAEKGIIDAMLQLGRVYRNWGYKISGLEDSDKAVYWYEKAAEKGNIDAMYELGSVYGIAGLEDSDKAVYWLEKAAEKGNVNAMQALGGEFSMLENYDKAVYWYEKAAEKGNVLSLMSLGQIYELISVTRNVKKYKVKAKEYYQKACDAGMEYCCEKAQEL